MPPATAYEGDVRTLSACFITSRPPKEAASVANIHQQTTFVSPFPLKVAITKDVELDSTFDRSSPEGAVGSTGSAPTNHRVN